MDLFFCAGIRIDLIFVCGLGFIVWIEIDMAYAGDRT